MNTQDFKRKLTAVFSADVAGYSRLMGEDESATVKTLEAYKEVMFTLIKQHRGRVIDSPGDNLLAEFASVVDAVQCGVAVQNELKARNADLPENRRMQFRIGINLGDVIEEGERIYGDGVNIAARLESLADPGGICVSKTAFDHIEAKLPLGYHFLGEQTVKNIAKPVGAYKVLMEPRVTGADRKGQAKGVPVWRRKFVLVSAVATLIVIVVAVVWNFHLRTPAIEPASKERMAFPLPDKPSIAVLPFVNMSEDPQQEYFSDGLTEDIITDLSAISQLFVIARNSTFAYKGRPFKIKQVAEELGVRYVLEGSVRKSGNEVRINSQLIDATTGHHLWAERYDGQLIDIFTLQDKISQKIVTALKVKLSVGEQEQVVRKETENIKAYDAFLQGWNYYRRNTPQDWGKAISHFQKAIELDPDFSRAYAAIAMIYWRYSRTSMSYFQDSELGVNYHEAIARAREYLELARIKPTSIYYRVEASMALYRRQYAKAVAEAGQSIDLDSNDVDGIYTLAYILMAVGKTERAVELIKKGMRLDPHNIAEPLYLLGMVHFARGQLKETVSNIERALTHNPKLPRLAPILPAALANLGQEQKAEAALANFKKAVINYDFRSILFNFPFQDPAVTDRLVDGIRKAGMWAPSFKYYKFFQENMLVEKEIRELIFGRKVAGVVQSTYLESPFLVERTVDGKATWSILTEKPGDYNDSGRSWIENDMLCNQWQIHFTGLKQCMPIFRNPEGTPEMKNEYIAVSDFGFQLFSPVD